MTESIQDKVTKRLIGDCEGVDALTYRMPITQENAQEMVDVLLAELKMTVKVNVIFNGYKTSRKWGRLGNSFGKHEMTIFKIGENEGAILHELAHLRGRGHDRTYKDFQRKLINTWYGETRPVEILRMAAGQESLTVAQEPLPSPKIEPKVATPKSTACDEVLRQLLKLPDNDMKAVLDVGWKEWRRRRDEEARKKVLMFSPGDFVKYLGKGNRRLPHGTIGKVERPKEKMVLVDFTRKGEGIFGFGKWNISAEMLERVPKDHGIEKKW